jgi:hypothetical protein
MIFSCLEFRGSVRESVRRTGATLPLLAALWLLPFSGHAQQPRLARHVFPSAGIQGSSIRASVGQPAIGATESAPLGGMLGFWAHGGPFITSATAPPLRPANLHVRVSPNPFRTRTMLHIEMPVEGSVRGDIVDASGRNIASLHFTDLAHGTHSVTWEARDAGGVALPSGTYRLLLRAADARGRFINSTSVLLVHIR